MGCFPFRNKATLVKGAPHARVPDCGGSGSPGAHREPDGACLGGNRG